MQIQLRQVLLMISLLFGEAFASGMEIPEQGARSVARGGATVTSANDGTATWLNPGLLSRLDGLVFTYSHNLLWVDSEFTRLDPNNEGSYLPTSSNEIPLFPINLFAALSHDLGTDHSTVALSVHGPNTTGHTRFDQDNSSRYLLNELDVLLIFYGASYAYGTDNFGFGITAQYVQLPRLNFGLVVDAAPNAVATTRQFDVRADLEMEDPGSVSALLGFWWRPTPNLEVGVNARPFPITLRPEGTAKVTLLDEELNVPSTFPDQVIVGPTTAKMGLSLPRGLRAGLRYRHLEADQEKFDIELNASVFQWSSLDKYDAKLSGSIQLPVPGDFNLNDVVIEKKWQDAYTLSLGGSYWIAPGELELLGGTFWESAAAKPAYAHLDFPAGERVGYGLGVSWYPLIGEKSNPEGSTRLGFTVAYGETFQKDIEVGAGEGRVYQQRPLSPCPACPGGAQTAVNEGLFKTHFRTLSLGLTLQGL